MPTSRHQLPAISVESRQPLRPKTFTYCRPELLFVLTSVKSAREFGVVGANVPEKDSESVNVDSIVVGTTKEFWCHVDGSADYGTCHHCFRLAKSKIC